VPLNSGVKLSPNMKSTARAVDTAERPRGKLTDAARRCSCGTPDLPNGGGGNGGCGEWLERGAQILREDKGEERVIYRETLGQRPAHELR
jgi:hypothetical protein